jgi:UDP-GlcNAc:undecaprenyl-phosphate GlcNAc-1-phosphate transferase
MVYLSTLLISMFITLALIPLLKEAALRMQYSIDFPNQRKVHELPKAKVGGLAMAVGILVPVALWSEGGTFAVALLTGSTTLIIFSLFDDMRGLNYKMKFTGQILAAGIVVFYGRAKICFLGQCLPEGVILPDVISFPLTILVIVGVTNAINLADGLDGLAGGISLLIFISIGYMAYTNSFLPGNTFIVLTAAAVVGAIVGFLRFNTYPATIFMGDVGSQLLGFLAISLSLRLTQMPDTLGVFSPFLPLLLVGFPVLDTLTVMTERIVNGKSPFVADKNHFHHKLLRLGLFHTEAVATVYGLTAAMVGLAFVLRYHSEWLLLALYIVFAGTIIVAFTLAERNGYKLRRFDLIDITIKGRLKILKDRQILIRISFRLVEILVPALLIFTVFLADRVPQYVSGISLGFAAITVLIWLLKKNWLLVVLRISFYLVAPMALYLSQVYTVSWMDGWAMRVYSAVFGLLSVFVVLTMKFTRRRKGVKTTPFDLLILFLALVVPIVVDKQIAGLNLSLLSVKMVVLYFSFEVLLGESRYELNRIATGVLFALLAFSAKGFFF